MAARTPLILTAAALALSSVSLQAESLWTKETTNERGMFADRRAKNVGDIVTLIVQENVTATQSQEIKTFKDSKPGGGIVTNLLNQFIAGIPAATGALTGKLQKQVQKLPNGDKLPDASLFPNITPPTLTDGGKDEYRGGGEVTYRQTVTSRTAVTVMDVLPNGNMVIEGSKVIRAGDETQYAYMRGVIRAADVQKDNTVLSSNVADAHIEFVPEGKLTEAQKKGWLQRLNDRLKLF